eukprot:CAMPEP_0172828554 /NCGR_PEP_ID=MMETSP1075-20121228/20925_1 /TAXON_ID=2916 /ORGANISM="Ceratium fusus, Strain PA161109" /LENGTH=93 /DNA_ID=CAMNT_0013670565 /DNA_START=182 /DNA_END=460 /DNA_ORIENTATION=-
MDQQQPLEVLELANCEVRIVHRLPALTACDADAHLSFLDHWHVIGTIADGCCDWLLALWCSLTDDPHELCLLLRAHTAGNEDGTFLGCSKEFL